jgi:hypothetical protein
MLFKVLSGSNISIMYVVTCRRLKLSESQLYLSRMTFHDVVLGKSAKPLG